MHNFTISAQYIRDCGLNSNDVGLSPVAFHFSFFFLFNLLVCSSSFLILCRHGYTYLNLAYVYSTNLNNFNRSKFINSLHAG